MALIETGLRLTIPPHSSTSIVNVCKMIPCEVSTTIRDTGTEDADFVLDGLKKVVGDCRIRPRALQTS